MKREKHKSRLLGAVHETAKDLHSIDGDLMGAVP
jgi:hypothetical protein